MNEEDLIEDIDQFISERMSQKIQSLEEIEEYKKCQNNYGKYVNKFETMFEQIGEKIIITEDMKRDFENLRTENNTLSRFKEISHYLCGIKDSSKFANILSKFM